MYLLLAGFGYAGLFIIAMLSIIIGVGYLRVGISNWYFEKKKKNTTENVSTLIKEATNWWANECFKKDFNDLDRKRQNIINAKFKIMEYYSDYLHSR